MPSPAEVQEVIIITDAATRKTIPACRQASKLVRRLDYSCKRFVQMIGENPDRLQPHRAGLYFLTRLARWVYVCEV